MCVWAKVRLVHGLYIILAPFLFYLTVIALEFIHFIHGKERSSNFTQACVGTKGQRKDSRVFLPAFSPVQTRSHYRTFLHDTRKVSAKEGE
jgi:hypothetical protein